MTTTVFVLYASLLYHLVFAGWAHTYDSAIYVRSLWGVANGELFNPMVDLHTLSIHGNFVLYALAPFARVMHPGLVLVLAQAGALAATTHMVVTAWIREGRQANIDVWSSLAMAGFVGFALIACTPMVTNPFLFDVRPDLLGIPLLTWGLCRAHRTGAFDVRGVAVMLLALLVREEYMMVIVGGLGLAPMAPRTQWRIRAAGIAIAVGYWAFYWFGFRNWIGDGSFEIAQQVGSAFLDASTLTMAQIAAYKLEILVVFAASVGGSVLIGWRWLGAAIPGLLLLLVTSRMQEMVLNFHYVEFVIPGLAVASVDGVRRWLKVSRSGGSVLPLVSAVLMTGSYMCSSALPAGGRHQSASFHLGVQRTAAELPEYERLLDAYRLVGYLPDDVGVALPHELAAPVSNRAMVRPAITYFQMLTPEQAPEGIDWVIAPGRNWAVGGRTLVDAHGFRLVEIQPPRLALFTRDPDVLPGESLGLAAIADCAAPMGAWPAAGLTLCGVERDAEGRLGLRIARTGAGASGGPGNYVLFAGAENGAPQPALAWNGLLNAAQLPVGTQFLFVTEGAVDPTGTATIDVVLTQRGPTGGLAPVPTANPASAGPGIRLPGTR